MKVYVNSDYYSNFTRSVVFKILNFFFNYYYFYNFSEQNIFISWIKVLKSTTVL